MLAVYRNELSEFQTVAKTFALYRENLMLRRAVERSLQVAAEICLDIGRRIASLEGYRYPENNRDVFYLLAEEKIISEQLLDRMLDLAGFRNFIVHQYAQVDDIQIYEILMEGLEDFDDFAEEIAKYIQPLDTEETEG